MTQVLPRYRWCASPASTIWAGSVRISVRTEKWDTRPVWTPRETSRSATVGKLFGMARAMKAGIGIYAAAAGPLWMAAVVIVNALGDICDPKTGKKTAGLRTEDGTGFSDTCQEMYRLALQNIPGARGTTNTTIGAIVTNGCFSKAKMNKIASMARTAYARCIRPVGTMADGDTIYAASVGKVPADINVAGTLAALAMEEAIARAVPPAKEARAL